MFRKSSTSPKWAHDKFSGEEGEIEDDESGTENREEKDTLQTTAEQPQCLCVSESPGRREGVQHDASAGDCQGDPEVLSRAPERSSETIPKLTAFPEFSLPKCGLELINHLCLDPLVEYIFPKTYLLD